METPTACVTLTKTQLSSLPYEDDHDAQQAAAKIVLGHLKPQGKLPVTASEEFKAGDGL